MSRATHFGSSTFIGSIFCLDCERVVGGVEVELAVDESGCDCCPSNIVALGRVACPECGAEYDRVST